MSITNRRKVLTSAGLLAGAAAAELVGARLALAAGNGSTDNRLVLVILRGALDGLSAVPPLGDPDYARLRGALALGKPGSEGGALALDGTFGLHPALAFMAESWRTRELAVLHAVATPYRERSHFDGQDVLENGLVRAHQTDTGWLNRALATLPRAAAGKSGAGIALGANIPLVMRGAVEVASWSPTRLASLDDDTLQRIADLYAQDPLLSRRLADALMSDAVAADANKGAGMAAAPDMNAAPAGGARRYGADIDATMRAAAGFLLQPEGPRVAVLDGTGWDTHANEGVDKGVLALRLRLLDNALRTLKTSLGPAWKKTAVLIVTEFGRTAAVNGTRGTDHGTGAAAFVIGGAVRGGRVIADWPSLAPGALYEGRDLRPTLDLRSVFKALLQDHLGVAPQALERQVFPDSGAAPPLRDLIA
jgi:uncharacterized protein (DUF1501 family)